MIQESKNPLSKTSDSSELTSLLCENILKLGNQRDLQREIDDIRRDCRQKYASEETLNVLLFQKFNELSETRKATVGSNIGLVGDIPSFIYESNEADLSGWSALRTNVFWIRFLVAIFAMMAFIIMCTSSIAGDIWFAPQNLMFNCNVSVYNGRFSTKAYHAVIGTGSTVFAVNILYLVYYILPLNENREKYLPGWKIVTDSVSQAIEPYGITGLISIRFSSNITNCCTNCWNAAYVRFEFLLDGVLFLISAAACVLSSIALERSEGFETSKYVSLGNSFYQCGYQYLTVSGYDYQWQYYTIGSFFATYTTTNPPCIDRYHDPGPKIRASLGMMYIAVGLLGLSTLVSFRSYRLQRRLEALLQDGHIPAPKEDPQVAEGLLKSNSAGNSSHGDSI